MGIRVKVTAGAGIDRYSRITMISSPRILILEDDLHDRQLLEETLLNEGLSCQIVHARTKEEFQVALEKSEFDLIISDFGIPSYSGIAALALSRQVQPDAPFIFVSGTIGEERAVESLKLGATDYVLKDRLGRLGQAVERALREAQERMERDRNIKKRKQLEEQLHQSQKMEAIGQLAGGIAHDFNNLLLVMHGNAELVLRSDNELDDQNRHCLKQVIAAAERATNLVRQLLAFSHKQVIHFQPFNLNHVIANLTKMVNRIIGEDISLQCHYAENLPPVQADVGMVEQALMNLIVNARDAMPQGGSLFIETEIAEIDETYVENHPKARAGTFVCVTVSDTGMGIAREHLPRIFEPFFTTKEVGKGTGLGLAMLYGIVKQHQGWVEVSSQLGEGTAFKIFLPTNSSGVKNTPPEPVQNNFAGGTEKILLVEDDPDVRKFVRHVLENVGYKICEAGSGTEALKIWKANASKFDLLLTDMVMPGGLNGGQLAEHLCEEQPKLKVIFMSGYNPAIAGKIQPNGCFIQKPCLIDALIKTVRDCLDSNLKNKGPSSQGVS